MKFHHIGLACNDVAAAVGGFQKTHHVLSCTPIIHDPLQDAHLCMVNTDEGIAYELVSGPIVKRLVEKGITYYHSCYETSTFEEDITRLSESGGLVVSPAKPAVLFSGRRVCFVYLKTGLVELLEACPHLRPARG